eukprot:1305572-Rhodomonas_salina.7
MDATNVALCSHRLVSRHGGGRGGGSRTDNMSTQARRSDPCIKALVGFAFCNSSHVSTRIPNTHSERKSAQQD